MARFFEVVKDECRKNDGDIQLPTRATEHSAGYDFYSPVDAIIQPQESMFSSRSFIVSGLTFRSLIHFEFIFVYGVRKCSSFIPLQVVYQFSQHHL